MSPHSSPWHRCPILQMWLRLRPEVRLRREKCLTSLRLQSYSSFHSLAFLSLIPFYKQLLAETVKGGSLKLLLLSPYLQRAPGWAV